VTGAASRGSISLLFALVGGEGRSARRRMRGFEGWGRHLSRGSATAAKSTFALTHPVEPARDATARPRHVIRFKRETFDRCGVRALRRGGAGRRPAPGEAYRSFHPAAGHRGGRRGPVIRTVRGGGRTAKRDGRAAMPRTDVPSTGPLSRLRSATRKLWYPPRDLSPEVSSGEPRLVVVAPRLRRDSVATGVVAGARITSTDM
jgi:hypothetical protein